ncbi:MAG: hypothetical protein WAQ28_05135 [Bacteroidia bacterium]|jgi:hypothetical protein
MTKEKRTSAVNDSARANRTEKAEPLWKKLVQPSQMSFKVVAAFGFVFTFLLLFFSYHYFGSYFEMNDDPRYVMAMKGFASPQPYNNFVSAYVFTSDIYIKLYQLYPNIGWYGLSMFLILWGALFNAYLAIYLVARGRISSLLTMVVIIAFFFLVFFQNVYWINFTRPSLLVTVSFIMLLAVLYLNNDVLKRNKWLLAFPVVTYVLGHLTRLDAGYLGFTFGSGFAFLLVYKRKSILPFGLKYILPVLVFIIIVKLIDRNAQRSDSRNEDFLTKTELIRQLIDYKNTGAYVPKTTNDTIIYNAMMLARYCSDDKIITSEFLQKLSEGSPQIEDAEKKKFESEFGAFLKSTNNENSLMKKLNYGILIVFLVFLLSAPKSHYFSFLRYFLFQLMFLTIIVGMSYYMKMPARIYNPLFVGLTLANILFLFSLLNFNKRAFYFCLLVPLFLVFVSIPAYSATNKQLLKKYRQYGKINHQMIDEMNNSFSNTVFIPTNLRSWEMHTATDPLREINFKNGNSYVYLSIELSLAPETKEQLKDKFGTDNHAELFKNISEMKNVVFISDDAYNNFLRAYYHYLYNQDYEFEKVGSPAFTQYTGLNFYRLKKQKFD